MLKAVNSNMVIAYWLIGREIVQKIQQGEDRAEYGQKMIETLSVNLTRRYGRGFSRTNLKYFRLFYQVYADRKPIIGHNICDESGRTEKPHKACGESSAEKETKIGHKACDVLGDLSIAVEKRSEIQGFSPLPGWSHYRALTRVEHPNEYLFYEIEAEKERWSVPHLQRQINTFLFVRLLKSRDKEGVMQLEPERADYRKAIGCDQESLYPGFPRTAGIGRNS